MRFVMAKTDIKSLTTDALIIPVYKEDVGTWAGMSKSIAQFVHGATVASTDFKGKHFEMMRLPCQDRLKGIQRIWLLGLGPQDKYNPNRLREALGKLARVMRGYPVKRAAVLCRSQLVQGRDWSRLGQTVAEGLILGSYEFSTYKVDTRSKPTGVLTRIELVGVPEKQQTSAKKGVETGRRIADSVVFARDLGNHPGNIATPTMLAKSARTIASEFGMSCTVLTERELKRLKMGALLGVAQGSQQPPRMIVLEHRGGKRGEAPIALVGKGVTFDSGGISLKPGRNMDEMKYDMSGGGNVLGAMRAVAALKLPVNVVGVVPAVENMPSSSADKPGDILTAMSGTTIEVLNTDAEGRLILADALSYVARYKPRAVVDMATLTGAVVIALGYAAAGVMGNDDELIDGLRRVGDTVGERIWPLPMYDDYAKQLKSHVADLRNIGVAGGGTCVAAAFLSKFAEKYTWAHLDIAGVAWTTKGLPLAPKGSTGFGVRLLVEWLRGQA